MTDSKEAASTAAQAAPSLTAIAVWVSEKDISFWAGLAGIAFILLQMAFLIWKWSWAAEVRKRGGSHKEI